MSFLEMLRTTVNSLSAHKLRTALSVLGILIGVASVIAMISVGQGATYDIRARVESLGADLVTVGPAFRLGRAGVASTQITETFTLELADELRKAPAVRDVVPIIQTNGTIKYRDRNLQTTLLGVTPAYSPVMNYPVARGRFLSEQDLDNYAKVLVLGSEVAQQLFPDEDPLGSEVVLERAGTRFLFTIIGVMTSKGQLGFGQYDNRVYLPVTTVARRITGDRTVNSYSLRVASTDQVDAAIAQVEFILSRRIPNPEDYRVRAQQDIIETVNQNAITMTFLLGGIAAISDRVCLCERAWGSDGAAHGYWGSSVDRVVQQMAADHPFIRDLSSSWVLAGSWADFWGLSGGAGGAARSCRSAAI